MQRKITLILIYIIVAVCLSSCLPYVKETITFYMKNTSAMSFSKRHDGSFAFGSTIEKLWDDEPDDEDDVALELTVKMPGNIVTANATSVNGITAKWVITHAQLTEELSLEAITESGSQPSQNLRTILFIIAGVILLILAGGISIIILRARRGTT